MRSFTETDVFLCVDDFGIGIAEDRLGKVFEQFYRVTGDKQNTFPGLGISLYISSEIVKRQHVKTSVESIEGRLHILFYTTGLSYKTIKIHQLVFQNYA